MSHSTSSFFKIIVALETLQHDYNSAKCMTMAFWPFKNSTIESLTVNELRQKVIDVATSASSKKVRDFCERYKTQLVAHADELRTMPVEKRSDTGFIETYIQSLGAVAQCLANECGVPELWDKLSGKGEDNPLTRWDNWFQSLPERRTNLEHDALIAEARQFIEEAAKLEGRGAKQYGAYLNGRLGELLFHSGKVADSADPMKRALAFCQEIADYQGQYIYLKNLFETHRYLGNYQDAISAGEAGLNIAKQYQIDCADFERQLAQTKKGEPLCRIVCHHNGNEYELDELVALDEGQFDFEFRRNRASLEMATKLTNQGMEAATSGQLADALEKFQEASEVDPLDPNPVYQTGVCLLDMGLYAQAKASFSEIERLAPGWFRCRLYHWMAEALDNGELTEQHYQVYRALDGGAFSGDEGISIAEQAIERYPDFAPLFLLLGNFYHSSNPELALKTYRRGLDVATEPDIESQLLCAAAGILPAGSSERREFVQRAVTLKGSLMAQATAALIGLK
jgi:tetratricopeptide (TPR) repeat protein